MALIGYLNQVRLNLHDPNAQFYSDSTLTTFINEGRQQVALEGECIRALGGFSTVLNQQIYQNSAIPAPATPAGIQNLLVPRTLSFDPQLNPTNTALKTLEKRPWDWFNFYWLGIAAPP